MKKITIFGSLCILSGCVSYNGYYTLPTDYLEQRQIETRRFETADEEKMLIACSQVLQDLEFNLETSNTELGLLTATKNREIGNTSEKVAVTLLAAFSGTMPVYDVSQEIYLTLVSNKSKDKKGYDVRASFARIIWNNMNHARIERITEPQVYRKLFDKLEQSLFLTANEL